MESDRNPFPEMHVLPTLKEVGHFLLRCVSFLPEQTLASHGDHFNRGAAPMLDQSLDEQ